MTWQNTFQLKVAHNISMPSKKAPMKSLVTIRNVLSDVKPGSACSLAVDASFGSAVVKIVGCLLSQPMSYVSCSNRMAASATYFFILTLTAYRRPRSKAWAFLLATVVEVRGGSLLNAVLNKGGMAT